MSKNNEKKLARYIVEIRHQPFMQFLDKRGEIADIIAKTTTFKLNEWAPSNDRVDFVSDDQKIKPFASVHNYGLSVNNLTLQIAKEKIIAFLNELWRYPDFEDRDVVRIGIKSHFIIDKGLSFDTIQKKYKTNFLNLNTKAVDLFEAELIDLGAPFNFKISEDSGFNTMSGPMPKSQMRLFFPDTRTFPDGIFPEAGLYFEIDFFKKNVGKTKKDILSSLISGILDDSFKRVENFKDYLLQ